MTPKRLVEPRFWDEEYIWAGARPPLRPDPQLAFDRTLMRALADYAKPRAGEHVVEIGCAPGKWLVHLAERHGARIEGIEYTAKGAAFTRANFEACGVDGVVVQADFFELEPSHHDLVLSLGFIEHFDDLAGVFARHVAFVRPGGRLVLGVPNFRGLNRLLQRRADPAYLALHNLEAMRPELWRRLAAEHGLAVEQARHIGGPDPVIVRLRGRVVTAVALLEARIRRLAVTERLNHPWLAPYLFMVFRRPA